MKGKRFSTLALSIACQPFVLLLLAISVYIITMPTIVPSDTSGNIYTPKEFKTLNQDILDRGILEPEDDSPAEIYFAETSNKRYNLILQSQTADIAKSLMAQSKYAEIELEETRNGTLVGLDEISYQVMAEYTASLANLKEPALYFTTTEEPMLYRLADIAATLPPQLLYIAPIVVAYITMRNMEDDRLAFQMPAPLTQKLTLGFLTAVIVCILGAVIAMLPAALISFVRNGVGDPNYPVMFIQDKQIISSTILATFLKGMGLWTGMAVFNAALVVTLFAFTTSAVPGSLIAVALAFVSSVPSYADEHGVFYEILHLLPTTYVNLASVAGWPRYLNYYEDILPVPGVSWQLGMAVFLICSIVLLILCFAGSTMKTKRVAA